MLRPYQEEALQTMLASGRSIYADPVGTGKTPTTLASIRESRRSLILAPKVVLDHWIEEAAVWAPGTEMILGMGTPTQRSRARGALLAASGPAALVLSYESAKADINHLINAGFDTLVCDEAHRLKDRKTATFKECVKIARRVEQLRLVTGTPVLNRAEELWSLLHMIDPKSYTSFWRWAQLHFDIETTSFHGKLPRAIMLVGDLKPGHLEKVRAEIGACLIQRDLELLIPDMPELIETTIHVDLSPGERKAYTELQRRHWTRMGEEQRFLQTSNEVSRITRLRQIASDWGVLGGEGHGSKVKATLALAKELMASGPVMIVTAFVPTAEVIAKELGTWAVTGEMKDDVRARVKAQFLAGEHQAFVGTLGVLREGIDGLQSVCSTAILVDRDWTPARNEQTLGRLRRLGQKSVVNAYHIVARDTTDELVDTALEHKLSVTEALRTGVIHD